MHPVLYPGSKKPRRQSLTLQAAVAVVIHCVDDAALLPGPHVRQLLKHEGLLYNKEYQKFPKTKNQGGKDNHLSDRAGDSVFMDL